MYRSLSEDCCNNLQKAIDTYSDRFPRNIIPIASSAGGNEICMDIDNEKILFWDHESSHLEGFINCDWS